MIAIIGGGISGLSLGHYLQKGGNTAFVIFEKTNRTGGKIESRRLEDQVLELGPNTLMTTPLLNQLLVDLKIEKQAIYPDDELLKKRFIKLGGHITALPSSPQKLLLGTLLGFKSKWAILKELTTRPTPVADTETVTGFFLRHFTDEIVQKLLTPFCRGIYGSSPDQLLIKSCFPELARHQELHGSIIKGLRSNKSLEKRRVLVFEKGLEVLTEALSNQLKPHLQKHQNIETVELWHDGRYMIKGQLFDQVVFCTPAQATSQLTEFLEPQLSKTLSKINYASLNIHHSIYRGQENSLNKKGFGVLYPSAESQQLLGHIWNTAILPRGKNTLITTMTTEVNPSAINELARSTFQKDYGLPAQELLGTHFYEWKQAIPVYDQSHLEFLKEYKKQDRLNLYICSNLLEGVSVPDRLKASKNLAQKLNNEK